MGFRDLGFKAKVYVLSVTTIGFFAITAWLAFLAVTLRRVVDALPPWEAVGAFLVVTLALVVAARATGLHETR